ncbi:MAG TPA: hypothetical protein PLH64_08175 [Anaerolineaceae bacterium]|nr:hypothetical protein [Anaerolineaceae bacterium]
MQEQVASLIVPASSPSIGFDRRSPCEIGRAQQKAVLGQEPGTIGCLWADRHAKEARDDEQCQQGVMEDALGEKVCSGCPRLAPSAGYFVSPAQSSVFGQIARG